MFDAVVRAGVRLLGVAALWLALPACSTTSPDGGGRRERPAEEGALGTVTQAIGTASGDCTSAVFGSEVYYFCADARSWTDARARCLSTPGLDLARLDGAGENAFVTSGMGGKSWISANDRGVEGAWRWSTNGADDGAQFWSGNSGGAAVGGLFANWEPGQPNERPPLPQLHRARD